MYNCISLSLGELVLKGKNRGFFEGKINKQVNKVIKPYGLSLYRDRGKVFIDTEDDIDNICDDLKNIFGIVYVTKCIKTAREEENIKLKVIEFIENEKSKKNISSFKIMSKRADKSYTIKSMDMNRKLGGEVLKIFYDMKVDVHNPQLEIHLDIREYCYIFSDRISGSGGLPVGTNGKGLVLLSGGIDSPVAAYLMAKRGVEVDAITFHAYPFTSTRAYDKTVDLCRRLSIFCNDITLYSINLLDVYNEIKKNCEDDEITIIARRFMMRIAEIIAIEHGYDFLITGECLGQVASQTAKSLSVIDSAVNIPILRPLIGMDKVEIVKIARNIKTYHISTLPYEDCCSIFSSDKPQTKPKKFFIEKSEQKLDIDHLIKKSINEIKKETSD